MTTHSRFTCVALAVTVIAVVPRLGPAQSSPQPIRWSGGSSEVADFDFARDTTIAHGGHASVRVHAGDRPTSFANVSATLPAQPYAGHTIRFSVFLRTAELGGGGSNLWARADATNQPNVAFGTPQQTPVRGTTDWTQVSLSLAIPQNAATLYIGVLSFGAGSLWIDDARLEADGGAAPMDFGFEGPADFSTPPPRPGTVAIREAPRAISPRGLANLIAFTNALGYVRFFHPSAEALGVNWDAFAVHGIRAVESASTPDSLASALRTVFAPIAPTVVFVRTGAAVKTTVPKPADATHVVFWRHEGVGVPTGGAMPASATTQNIYHSERIIVPIGDVGREIPMRAALNGAPIVSRPHVPDPSRPLVVALDGGVTISVPLALYTTYAVVPEFQQTPHAAAVDERFTANDRATRLADVALSWSLFENFYPYFDVVHTDWPNALTTALRSAATDRDVVAFQATLERLVAALHDGHGRVSSQMNMTAAPDIQFGWAEGRVFVTGVGDSGGRERCAPRRRALDRGRSPARQSARRREHAHLGRHAAMGAHSRARCAARRRSRKRCSNSAGARATALSATCVCCADPFRRSPTDAPTRSPTSLPVRCTSTSGASPTRILVRHFPDSRKRERSSSICAGIPVA